TTTTTTTTTTRRSACRRPTGRNIARRISEILQRKDERTRLRWRWNVTVRSRTNGIGSVPLEGELSRYCRSGSSPLDKAPRSKRPPFWCSTG
ncbi:hypothetical protein ALC62_11794, partial [Cyphomyrmex costatus]